MVTITSSVGNGGVNKSADVRAIQQALNKISTIAGGPDPKLKEDGIIGPKTNAAILNFQRKNLGLTPDGKVDTKGSTLSRINFILDGTANDPKTLALADMVVSNFWAVLARTALDNPAAPSVQLALEKHFHLSNGRLSRPAYLDIIRVNYTKVLGIFARAAQLFRSRNLTEATSDRAIGDDGRPFPAYTFFASSVNFSNEFHEFDGALGFGPMCRSAMVLHEPVHFVDRLATPENDFPEHGALYDTLSADLAVHNPSSYVCFAEQIVFGSDVRFGAGKRAL